MRKNKKTSQLAHYVEWLRIKSYFNKNMKATLHRQPSIFTQEVFKRMMLKHKLKMIILFLFIGLFTSCEKEPISRTVYFTFEVIKPPLTLLYLEQDGHLVEYRMSRPGKPVFTPNYYPEQITIKCKEECLYKVNGIEYTESKVFNF